jgi:tetratricopeptide (TPR) repeat protein
MPDTPTRFERFANWFDGLRKVLVALAVSVAVIVVVAAVVRELAMGGIAIDAVVVKATDTPDAPTPELAAQQIARQLDRIQRSGAKEWRKVHVDDGVHPLDLQIPGAPLSLRGAAREVVALFGLAPVTLRSALRRNDKGGYSAVMSLAGDHGSMANCPAEGGEDTLDNIYECIAFSAIAFTDPKTAASYMFKREQAECKAVDLSRTANLPDLQREEHRINDRRDRCSFAKTLKLIAKVMDGGNKADLRWAPYIYGQVHMARAESLAGLGLPVRLQELDQAIGRFLDSQRQMRDSPTAVAVLMKAFLDKGTAIHQSTALMPWDDNPKSLLQTRLELAEKTFAEAADQLQEIPSTRTASLDALVNRLEGLLIYRRWMIDAHRRTKSGAVTVAIGQQAELAALASAVAKYEEAAKLPLSPAELIEWGNIIRATGKFEDAIAKYRRAADLDPGNPDPVLNIAIGYINRFTYGTAQPPDTGHLLVALGSLADYLAWASDGGPYDSLIPTVTRLLAGVGHGQAFEHCLNRTLAGASDPKVGRWKAAAAFKFCVDEAIDLVNKEGILATDVNKASR